MRQLTFTLILLTGFITTACSADSATKRDPPGRPVTADEASLMALTRYNAWLDSPLPVSISIPDTITVEATVDYQERKAVGSYVEATGQFGMIVWTDDVLATAAGVRATQIDDSADTLPGEWSRRDLGTGLIDRVIRLTMGLGDDRPDNSRLIMSGGARWLRSETIDGIACDVFSGPRPSDANTETSPLSYWITPEGRLRKVSMKQKNLPLPAVIDVHPQSESANEAGSDSIGDARPVM